MPEGLIIPNAVEDRPDERDFLWSEYSEWDTEFKAFPWDKLKVRNQNAQKETYKACSAYGLTAIYNWLQLLEFAKRWIEWEQEDPRWKWNVFQAERGYPDSGASLQDMMKFFIKRWKIEWYLKCNTAQECKNALSRGCGIYTWSAKCNWTKSGKEKKFVYSENGSKHCFAIVWYDDNWLVAINSFGENWGDKWYFYIPDENYKDIYSTYAILDHDDTWQIEAMRYEMEYNKAIELGITNWTRPDDTMTRKEWAVMCIRTYKKIIENNR